MHCAFKTRQSESYQSDERQMVKSESLTTLFCVVFHIPIFLFCSTYASASMPALQAFPGNPTILTCNRWAESQDEDALYMWGILESGEHSEAVGQKRLATYCLRDVKPEIVGFGSSAGFDEAYCLKHKDQAICRP
jgi:hypothetical protein